MADDAVKLRGQQGATLPRVRSISRAVAILRAFSQAHPHRALNEIVRETGLDAGTTRRILVTLRDEGLVFQDPSTGLYSASAGLLELARAVPESLTLINLVDDRLHHFGRSIRLADALEARIGANPDDHGVLAAGGLGGDIGDSQDLADDFSDFHRCNPAGRMVSAGSDWSGALDGEPL